MYFMYIKPGVVEVKALTVKKEQLTNVLNSAQELSAKRDEILAKYNAIPQEDIDRLNKIIPATFESEVFVNDLNNLAVKNGLKMKSIKDETVKPDDRSAILDTTTTETYKTNSVSVTISGGYNQFLSFLSDIESNLHLIDIKSVSLKSTKDAKS